MKEINIHIGDIVFLKKSSLQYDGQDNPRIVNYIQYRGNKPNKIFIDNLKPVNSGELTDIPCSQMDCKNCKYH